MEGICVFKWTLQLEFWSIRGRNFRCNTSCVKNGRKITDTTWFEQIERSSMAWSHSIRYDITIGDQGSAILLIRDVLDRNSSAILLN